MLLLVENQQTINRSLRQCPKFGGGSSTLQKETKAQIAMMFLNIPATVAACKAGLIRFRPRMGRTPTSKLDSHASALIIGQLLKTLKSECLNFKRVINFIQNSFCLKAVRAPFFVKIFWDGIESP